MDQQYAFEVAEADGKRTVRVDGEDITDSLEGVEFHMHDGRPSALMLYTKPGSLELEGRAFIYMQPSMNGQVLDDLDPLTIQAEALRREEFGGKTFVENVLDIVKEKLVGA